MPNATVRASLIATCALVCAAPAFAQRPAVRIEPEAPVQGTLFRVHIEAPRHDVALATGSAAGQPLHFHADSTGRLSALGAAPLDGDSILAVSVVTVRGTGAIDTVTREVRVLPGSYRLERLTVAPRFGAPPDSAMQARLERDRALAAEVSRRTHTTPRLWQEVVLPRDSRITSTFGSGREFNGRVQSRHTGTDFQGAPGAPVRAAARGVVALADTLLLAGRAVYLDHGAGLVTAYFHLSETLVAEGDTVAAGQRIGSVGATGRVTGPHLHWVVRYGPVSVDPMSLMALAGGR